MRSVARLHGFLEAAGQNAASAARTAMGTEVFTAGAQRFAGVINARNEVERVRTSIANPVVGDMLVEASYRDYEEVNGIRLPMYITQKQGGHRSLELWVASVGHRYGGGRRHRSRCCLRGCSTAGRGECRNVTPGVHLLTGGSHHSAAIELRDRVVGASAKDA